MNTGQLDTILKAKYKTTIPEVNVGSTVKIVIRLKEKTKDKNKDKTQTIQGLVISKKHGKEMGGHFTVRRILDGIGTEWTIPMYSDDIISFEVMKASKVKRAKLYYIREKSVRETKSALKKELKTRNIKEEVAEEVAPVIEEIKEEKIAPVIEEVKEEAIPEIQEAEEVLSEEVKEETIPEVSEVKEVLSEEVAPKNTEEKAE